MINDENPPFHTVGFDTASSIALLAVSAVAKKGPDGKNIAPANIVVLPVRTCFSTLQHTL